MAVFLENICKFDNCGKVYPELSDLILHIEECHIDYNLKLPVVDGVAQAECLPLSYILKYSETDADMLTKNEQKPNKSLLGTNPVVLIDEGKTMYDANNDVVLMTAGCFTPDLIYHAGRINTNRYVKANNERPFACPVPGCHKRYKNVNGIKYHSKNGHKNLCRYKRDFMCPCGKMYKTSHGLKSHALVHRFRYQEAVVPNGLQLNRRCASMMEENAAANMSRMMTDQNVDSLMRQRSFDCEFNGRIPTAYYGVIGEIPHDFRYNPSFVCGNSMYVPKMN